MQSIEKLNNRKFDLLKTCLSLYFFYWFVQQILIEKTFYNFELIQKQSPYSFLSDPVIDFIIRSQTLYLSCLIGLLATCLLLFSKKPGILFLTIWAVLIFILYRNPSSARVWTTYAGWLLLAMPAYSYEIRCNIQFPKSVDISWYVAGLSYFTSGVSKILEPHWRSGTALYELYGFPVKTELYLFFMEYKTLMIFTNYYIILIEVLALPLMFTKKYRLHSWITLFIMHLFVFFTIRIRDVSFFMIIFSLFLFEPKWLLEKVRKDPWLKLGLLSKHN